MTASPQLTKEVWRKIVFSFMTSEQIEQLAQQKKLDLAVDLKEIGLFRALISVVDETYNLSIYTQAKAPGGAPKAAPAASPEATLGAVPSAATPPVTAPPAAVPPAPSPSAQTAQAPAGEPGGSTGAPAAPRSAVAAALQALKDSKQAAAPKVETSQAPAAPVAAAAREQAPAVPEPVAPTALPRVVAAEAPAAPAEAEGPPTPPSKPAPPAPPSTPPPISSAAPPAPPTPPAQAAPEVSAPAPAAPVVAVTGLMPGQALGPPVPATHPYRDSDVQIDELLSILLDKGGSDLHLHEQKQPLIRADGRLIIAHEKAIDSYNMMAMIESVTDEKERALLFARHDLDTSYNLKALSRFRVNILNDTRGWGMVLRVIPFKIPNWKDLGVPESARNMAFKPHGLFLVTGPTGSGKSTTLASLIHDVNQTQYKHIVTVEDPIEFVHNDAKSCITQREVGVDTPSFARGVVDVLRQDPDLILVGEMRDLETMSNALLAAESGRLVMATLHTTSCAQTIERIINVFPEEAQSVARTQLSNSIVGILSQALLPKKGGGRIAAFEIMIATESIRNLLRENKPQMLQTAIETGAKFGMKSLDQHLLELVEGGMVQFEDAYAKCQNTKNFKALEAKLKGVPVAALADE
ncbi:MAG: PilT/PilU family type 4a pilus ATPase [Candidatus Wallbacteria bacterium]|nr:PilT/PilU family type 4a pilus ATPase [Candidatus Wallbacteria bacterium]